MYALPNPLKNPLLSKTPAPDSLRARSEAARLADGIAALERKAARKARLYSALNGATASPVRWFRPEPRPSFQYAGHMSTESARDKRLAPQAKALLTVLRARCGHGTTTPTCKTTLAHIMGTCTRSIGRYLADLRRFGYITTRTRRGAGGLAVGLCISITEKVLPCFHKLPWLSGWLAQNLPANGGNSGRTELPYTNHSYKKPSTMPPELRGSPPS